MHLKTICVRSPQRDEALKTTEAEQPVTSVNNQKRRICSFQCAARQKDEPGRSFITIIISWNEEGLERLTDAAANKHLWEFAAQMRRPLTLSGYLRHL